MAGNFVFDNGPAGRSLRVDASGRLLATGDVGAGLFVYGYGDSGRALMVDASGRLAVVLSGGAGEANTASNIGSSSGLLYSGKVGVDLQIRSLAPGSGIRIETIGNTVRIDNTNDDDITLLESQHDQLQLDFTNSSGNIGANQFLLGGSVALDVASSGANQIVLGSNSIQDTHLKGQVHIYDQLHVYGCMHTPVSSGTVDGNETINMNVSNVFRLHWMDGVNSTLTLSGGNTGAKYTFILVNAQGGDGAVVWPANVLWQGGNGMTSLTPGANKIDVIGMTYDGVNYYAASGADFS